MGVVSVAAACSTMEATLTFSVQKLAIAMRTDRQSKVEGVGVARVEGEVARPSVELEQHDVCQLENAM